MLATVQDILKKYPIRNSAWSFRAWGAFIADASDLGHKPGTSIRNIKDPWNREFPEVPRPVVFGSDILEWRFGTTVEGQAVECRVKND
jgi:hypothetical protein